MHKKTSASSQSRINKVVICLAFIMKMSMTVNPHPLAHKISRLPSQPSVPFQQFAGYVTVDDEQQRSLFYYFVEAEKTPQLKPLVLWLNGGPGCSSVGGGAFTEHGPFLPINGQALRKNDYSWNKGSFISPLQDTSHVVVDLSFSVTETITRGQRQANMLYLESPAGVGFSYSANKSFYVGVNDDITARDSLIFLQRWFLKYPEYKNNEFFIAGESYAGHYVPQLAKLIVASKAKFNLKGILIGNPALEFTTDSDTVMDFYFSHGMITDSTHVLFSTVCSYSKLLRAAQEGRIPTPACIYAYLQYRKEQTQFIDKYFVIGNYCITTINDRAAIKKLDNKLAFLIRSNFEHLSAFDSDSLRAQPDGEKDVENYEDCLDKKASKYLNRKDVQKALHARLVGVDKWTICSNKNLQYDRHDLLHKPTIGIIGSLVKSGIRVLIYSGDQDSVVPFIGTRRLVNKLAKSLGLKTTVSYRAWFESKQVGGWTQVYGDKLSYATIRGASHSTPGTQPGRSFLLFKSFLQGKSLPLKP